MWYIYVIQSIKNGTYYTGSTNNLERRLHEHNNSYKKNSFSYKNRPYQLVHFEKFDSRPEAIAREKYLKTGKGREEIQRLLKTK
ncbi:MAG: hypothetical protein A2722_01285 [Candidatus Doudnabacteria bacterium RIFCSPHIGHO2_01_FULL_50_11]|uniref:GIY-YIG domain-containing protein n=1 Tax=Candidatus Doudnabacteria bacterium RIFCSPHIGHO2_01_FULL_50_11 TaxID=1817828 RepID=A0A1F5PH68_9BACT|nr:MAG: hypothetical protein A2722_01285 [Candidatus Doudnabacteria bacterium RIFCSPHIGHO2_01_FULL_50_11]